MPYLVFALIFGTYLWILLLLLLPSTERWEFIIEFIKGLTFLWIVTGFLMLVMMRKLRDISIEKFLDHDMPYPLSIKENMPTYLNAVFSPYKLKNKKEAPLWFKRHPLLLDHLYLALFFSTVAGVIGFILCYLRPLHFGLKFSLVLGVLGSAGAWFFGVMMGHMAIGITGILRKLSKELENTNEDQTFASIVKIKELKTLPLNILYSYTSVMISFIAVLRTQIVERGGQWMYGNIFLLVVELSFFVLVLIIPNYYVHLIIKSVKENYKKRKVSKIKDLENKIHNEPVTDIDLKKYEWFVNMVDKAERVSTWPFDVESVTKIVITGFIGSIPVILQIFFIK